GCHTTLTLIDFAPAHVYRQRCLYIVNSSPNFMQHLCI
ncbi:hypothetical protein, partial [Salmonella enterica subsp. enterica serovar Kentucky]